MCHHQPVRARIRHSRIAGNHRGWEVVILIKKKDEENYQTERNQKDLIGNTQFNQCDKTRDINK